MVSQADWLRTHKNDLPPTILEVYKHNESTAGGRAKNTDLINSSVVRDGDGYYSWDLANPHVSEALKIFEERYRKVQKKGLIKNEMVTLLGGPDGFAEAKARGDCWSTTDDNGKETWWKNDASETRKSGWRDSSRVDMGSKKIDPKKAGRTVNVWSFLQNGLTTMSL